MYISLFTVARPVNYINEFQKKFRTYYVLRIVSMPKIIIRGELRDCTLT
jgi:hypothetical protein